MNGRPTNYVGRSLFLNNISLIAQLKFDYVVNCFYINIYILHVVLAGIEAVDMDVAAVYTTYCLYLCITLKH